MKCCVSNNYFGSNHKNRASNHNLKRDFFCPNVNLKMFYKTNFKLRGRQKMKYTILILTVILGAVCGVFGQTKTIAASEIVNQIASGKTVSIENATVGGDLDLTNLPNQINDAVYPEKGKTARVFSGVIGQKISFKNVIFSGGLKFFRNESDAKEIREYRVQFNETVAFENCTFEKDVNFELTNFNNGVSLAGSIFKETPLFVRIGLEKFADLENVVFEQNAIFQFTQNNPRKIVSVNELKTILKKSLEN